MIFFKSMNWPILTFLMGEPQTLFKDSTQVYVHLIIDTIFFLYNFITDCRLLKIFRNIDTIFVSLTIFHGNSFLCSRHLRFVRKINVLFLALKDKESWQSLYNLLSFALLLMIRPTFSTFFVLKFQSYFTLIVKFLTGCCQRLKFF